MAMLILGRYVGESVCVGDVALWVVAKSHDEVSFLTADASLDLPDNISMSMKGTFTSRPNDTFEIESKSATVTVLEIRGDKIRIGIECPQNIPVHRKEIYDAIQAINWKKRNFEMQVGDCICIDRYGVNIEAIASDAIQFRVRKVVNPYSLREPVDDCLDKEFVDHPDNNRLLAIGDSFSPYFSMTRVTLLSIENNKVTVEFNYPDKREIVESLDEFHQRLDREEEEAQNSPFGISRLAILEERARKAAAVAESEKARKAVRKPFWKKLASLFTG